MEYTVKTGRNERCPCGSGKKYKKCCLNRSNTVVVIQENLNVIGLSQEQILKLRKKLTK